MRHAFPAISSMHGNVLQEDFRSAYRLTRTIPVAHDPTHIGLELPSSTSTANVLSKVLPDLTISTSPTRFRKILRQGNLKRDISFADTFWTSAPWHSPSPTEATPWNQHVKRSGSSM